ncbi:MAG: GGDEF domain-containing protein [Bacillota bacterium]
MNRLFNKLKNLFALIIILIIFVSYFGVYIPLKSELEDSLHQGFKNMVSNAEITLENHLNRAVEGAASLSSRTMIRRELEKYKAGEITFGELQEYTQLKYKHGASIQDHLLAAYRLVDGRILAHYGREYSSLLDNNNFLDSEADDLIITADQRYIIINSPILNEAGNKIGSDHIIYDLGAILLELNTLNSEEISYNILEAAADIKTGIKAEKIIELRKLNNTNYFLKAETSAALIYDTINSISYKIILVILVTILVISFLVTKVLHDTSEKIVKNLRKELKEKTILSETDKMLGVYNRAKFDKELDREMDRAKRYGSKLALIMIDIDHFKEFNDNYGHNVGDQILKRMVSIVKEKIRQHDILARYGGDEFMIICPETSLEDAEKLAQRLNQAIDNYNCRENNDLSCSFGVAEYKKDTDDQKSLINRVDQALYKAKGSGRNRVCKNAD